MIRIVICRHGNTFDKSDVVTRVGARTDLPLSQSGVAQARALADHFSSFVPDFTFSEAYCSPLQRTQQTGEAILTSKHAAKGLTSLDFLTEIDYGIDENVAEVDVVARLGQDAITQWDEKSIPPEGWNVDPEAIIGAWKSFFKKYKAQSGDILVVTSNGIARFALDAVDEIATDAPRKLRTAAYGIIEIENGVSKVTAWDKRATD